MKVLKSVIVITAVLFASCSDKEEAPAPGRPKLNYDQTELTVPFFNEKDSGLPTLQWNGEIGNISLSNYISGITLNENNGVLSINKFLPLGTSNITVVATNSVGQSAVTFEIHNEFQGGFDGGYNNNPASENVNSDLNLIFEADGSTTISTPHNSASGTWTRDGDMITAVYSLDSAPHFLTFEGKLTYNSSAAAKLKGFYYHSDQVVAGSEKGFIHIEMH